MTKYALRVFGGAIRLPPAATSSPPTLGGSYAVVIDGTEQFVIAGSLQVESRVGKRSQASCTIRTTTATHFQQYEDIQIFDKDGTLVFNGYLDKPKESKRGFQKTLIHSITAIDGHWLADKRRAAKVYVNQTCGSIVYDLWNSILRLEGVSIGAIFDGPTPSPYLYPSEALYPGDNVTLIPSAVFAYCKVSEALDSLVKQSGYSGISYYWQIDELKRLWFVPYTYIRKPEIVDGATIDEVYNPPFVQRSNPTYFNTKWVTGAVVQTSVQTKTIGDGQATSFTMDYPLYSAPTITVSKTVGIKGTDTGKDFYWAQGDPVIAQDTSGTVLTAAQCSVSYIGQYPTIFYAQDAAQVAYQSDLDSSTGIVEDAEENSTITSFGSGISYISEALVRYAKQGVQFQFSTLDASYSPGQLITVDLEDYALDKAEMLVESVDTDDQTDGYNLWHRVNAIKGPTDTTWQDFFSKLLKTPQKAENINVGVSQVLNTLQTFTANVNLTAMLTVKAFGGLAPSNSLFPANGLYPS